MSQKKKNLLAGALLALMVIAAALAWLHFSQAGIPGDKLIALRVTHSDGSISNIQIRTDSENLRGAIEQDGLASGEESAYGLYVTTVDGETADEGKRQWWCFSRDGEMLPTGVDDTMIADGESYEAVMSTY